MAVSFQLPPIDYKILLRIRRRAILYALLRKPNTFMTEVWHYYWTLNHKRSYRGVIIVIEDEIQDMILAEEEPHDFNI